MTTLTASARLLIALGLLMGAGTAQADPLDHQDMLKAIIGEAEGEPYAGKVALAYALKNRGKMSGVYGHKAIIWRSGAFWRGSRRISQTTLTEAQNALKWANLHPANDPTHGADHWENIKAFGVPYWAKGKKPCYVIGSHAFYNNIK